MGAFPLELEGRSEYTLLLHAPPMAGEYRAQLSGAATFELVAEVPDFEPLSAPEVTRLEVAGGVLEVEWAPVAGAVEYFVFVRSPGTPAFSVRGEIVEGTRARFEDLPPDAYEVTIEARDHTLFYSDENPLPVTPRVSTLTTTFQVRR